MGNVVYSTEKGRICPDCGAPTQSCNCKDLQDQKVLGSGKVRVRREVKGRGGKAVTVITGLPMNKNSLTHCCREMKRKLGVGGSLKGENIEIQGDHVTRILNHLKGLGIDAKKGGG
jgi:translation initiation factor 1